MIDIRDVQLVDNTFHLNETINENNDLKNTNKGLFWLVIVSSSILIGLSLYLIKQEKNDSK
ncbi:hypothetical protein [Yeosuana marina]|uniref:hypothetical protein n=1 Tax=Yeosuana marina TaxID=1565536 RepID=UPI0030EE9F0D|tara:strand:- start:1377 stop:1559 length:183 start_codon:yes stop_codon:yes gene_type:complete